MFEYFIQHKDINNMTVLKTKIISYVNSTFPNIKYLDFKVLNNSKNGEKIN
jgi:hypothetical protein